MVRQYKYHYIYKITNVINSKFYIGKRSSNTEPTKDNYLGSGKLIQQAIIKYGVKSFTKEILETCIDIVHLNEREIYWIDFYKAIEFGYNILKGGEGGDIFSQLDLESQKQKSLRNSEHAKRNMQEGIGVTSRSIQGKHITESFPEIKEKWKKNHAKAMKEYSERCKSKNYTEAEIQRFKRTSRQMRENNPRSKKVKCIELDRIFTSISQACEFFGLTTATAIMISIEKGQPSYNKKLDGKTFIFV